MKFSTALAAAAAAISLSSALPATDPYEGFPKPPAGTIYYYFKVKAKAGQPTTFNDLYLTAYHTHAGQSDAVLDKTLHPAHRGWFNETVLMWFDSSDNPKEPEYFELTYSNTLDLGSTSWTKVRIDALSPGDPGLALDAENKLIFTGQVTNYEYVSWLVCDWFHSVPQLFALKKYPPNPKIPSNCAKVDLVAEVAPLEYDRSR
ncbi:hypothetical protein FKW77_008697 [Venturia effusa]|uniref:DUF7907 domain-containing protein n=1 Tax=Venturia effusa TaxID=50376 RepID=A0A517L1U1_9PEZI|nr:hypothetical protein FKW77_008697 [Venturia effusa]